MKKYFKLQISVLIFSLIFGANLAYSAGASLFLTSANTAEEGKTVIVDVRVNSGAQSINAVSGIVYFPQNLLSINSISKSNSLISLWISEPKLGLGQISFEGVALNPGYTGGNGLVFRIIFNAKNTGTASVGFREGSVLANDGLGTNVLTTLGSTSFQIVKASIPASVKGPPLVITKETVKIVTKYITKEKKMSILPVITDYSIAVNSKDKLYLNGKGEPNALTKITFKDVAVKSLGEKFMEFLQSKKNNIEDVLVKNDSNGDFQYVSTSNLVAGVYNATPFLVEQDSGIEKPGFGVQLFVTDSKTVKYLIVVINILGLLVPIVTLCVIIYFIPWFSFRKMRVLKKKMDLEEEKIELEGITVARGNNALGPVKSLINEEK